MSRDYAKKPRSNARSGTRRRAAPEATPGWVIFLAGFILGSIVSGYCAMQYFEPQAAAPVVADKPRNDNVPKPRFDFYKLLQESETIVPANETNNREETPAAKAQVQADGNEYLLQVGSFPTHADADRLRAQLLLMGLDARIEKVEIRKGEVWHRAMVGPFTTQAALNKARSTLVAEGYNALVLKRAKAP